MGDMISRGSDVDANGNLWFALRVTYQRELKAKAVLDQLGIENFLPTRLVKERDSIGRFVWVRRVAIHNYIFVRSTKEIIDDLKMHKLPWLRYVTRPVAGRNEILTVPDNQMKHFIAVVGTHNEHLLYLDPNDENLKEGDLVRIIAGPFAGVEGIYVRLNNQRSRRVVVRVEGITAVATASVPLSLIEKIEK